MLNQVVVVLHRLVPFVDLLQLQVYDSTSLHLDVYPHIDECEKHSGRTFEQDERAMGSPWSPHSQSHCVLLLFGGLCISFFQIPFRFDLVRPLVPRI